MPKARTRRKVGKSMHLCEIVVPLTHGGPVSSPQTKETLAEEFDRNLVEYIQSRWGEVLGDHVQILDEEGGLHKLAALIHSGELEIPAN